MDTDKKILCKDCRHAKVSLFDGVASVLFKYNWYEFARCKHPEMKTEITVDLVTGRKKGGHQMYADSARVWGCNKEARFFEPKQSGGGRCDHDISTEDIDGTTRYYCPKCRSILHGSQAEFPNMNLGEIMHAFVAALPESDEAVH